MKASANSLFSRVRRRPGRTLLTFTLLAVLGLAADQVQAVAVSSPTFSANGTVTYRSNSDFTYTGGTLKGTSLPIGTNLVTGANYTGGPINYAASATTTGVGVLQEFGIAGAGSGALGKNSDEFSGVYHFDLAATPAAGGSLTIVSWTLMYAVDATGGGGSSSVNGTGTGDFSGTVLFPITGADNGASLLDYSASLTITYLSFGPAGAVLSVTVPNGSIDFNAVPEPGTWALLLAGGLGMGIPAACMRRRAANVRS